MFALRRLLGGLAGLGGSIPAGAPLHTAATCNAWSRDTKPAKFLYENKKVYPPQKEGEERRPAFVCHQTLNIKYSPDKMWYIACFVRGMSVDEAVRQLGYVQKKGAAYVRDTILQAQELAVKNHHVEFKSNLWITESFAGKGITVKGIRRHAKKRVGEVRYYYCHYFVRLEEGEPPKDYYNKRDPSSQELLDKWLTSMRSRKVIGSL